MAYDTSNPPRLVSQAIAGKRTWEYESADSQADVNTDGYFSDGQLLGMEVNDLVYVTDTDTSQTSIHVVLSLSTSDDSVDLNDGLAITNTDTD